MLAIYGARLGVLFAALAGAEAGSPVQKVIQLLGDTKGKILRDLKAEESEMTKYAEFCDDEATKKSYAIKTAGRSIAELSATIEEATANIADLESEIAALGAEIASKDREVANSTAVRHAEHKTFVAVEKEMVQTVDQLTAAVVEVRKGVGLLQAPRKARKQSPNHERTKKVGFLQTRGKASQQSPNFERAQKVSKALSAIVDAAWVSSGDRHALKGFLQQTEGAGEDDDLVLSQPQGQSDAMESSSGGIVEKIEEMKEKAEETLTGARNTEMKQKHAYDMMQQSLQQELKLRQERKADATASKEGSTEEKGRATSELSETVKTKSADESYLDTLKSDCQAAARAWEVRQSDATAELAAIAKATEILSGGVRVFFVQTLKGGQGEKGFGDDADETPATGSKRTALMSKLKSLAHEFHSFAMMQAVTAAAEDPFGKIRGLIEDMIAKLVHDAQQEATQQAFCSEEVAKTKKSQEEKSMSLDKYRSRSDKAAASKALLMESVKELQAEIAEIDSGEAEATELRNTEHEAFVVGAKDFKDAAEATEQAIVVLKEYYQGSSLVQVASADARQPKFGSAKGGAGHAIISILEMAAEDFTKTLTELEAEENEKAKDYAKLVSENKVSRAAKTAEFKGKESEIKALTSALSNYKTDGDMVSKELDAVLEYMEKLRPQCETKVMAYSEKKARREAEIEGLKEALSILGD